MFCVAVKMFIRLPSGLYQVSVGVGTPSDTHFNVTFWPIQDLAADEVMLSIFAGSVTKILKETNNKSYRKSSSLGDDGGGERLIESGGAYFIFHKSWPDMIIF